MTDLRHDIELCEPFSTPDDFFQVVERLVCGFFSLRSFDEFIAEAEAAATSEAKKRSKSSSSSSSLSSKGVSDGRGKAVERREQVEVNEHENEAKTETEQQRQQQQRIQMLEHLDVKRRGQYEVIESIVRVFGETREAWRKGLYRKEERRRVKEEREARFQAKRRAPNLVVYPTRARGGDGEGDQFGAKTIVELVLELESLEFADLVTEEQHVVGTSLLHFVFFFSSFMCSCLCFCVCFCFCFCFCRDLLRQENDVPRAARTQ